MVAPSGRALAERPVRAMTVIVLDVLTQDQPQVPLAGYQHPVQALAPGAGNPPLRDRVRTRHPDRRPDDPHVGSGEHRVKGGGELGVPVLIAIPGCQLDAWMSDYAMPERAVAPEEQVWSNMMDPPQPRSS
jgi:hypothetical protein